MTHQDVLTSFTRIREAAEAHMDELDELGHGWAEESVTDVAVHRGHPHVKIVKVSRRQEATVGGDYLWWWLDRSSSLCFGMLVQAKRLTRSGSVELERDPCSAELVGSAQAGPRRTGAGLGIARGPRPRSC